MGLNPLICNIGEDIRTNLQDCTKRRICMMARDHGIWRLLGLTNGSRRQTHSIQKLHMEVTTYTQLATIQSAKIKGVPFSQARSSFPLMMGLLSLAMETITEAYGPLFQTNLKLHSFIRTCMVVFNMTRVVILPFPCINSHSLF